ncbi:hypothetical protein DYB31_016053, partial [Aphanomyces astaci]
RELHVYGQLVVVNSVDKSKAQHGGFGTQLMLKAEEIAQEQGFTKMAVIAGVGVRNFYRKLGFEVEGDGELMIKHFPKKKSSWAKPEWRWVAAAAMATVAIGVAALKKRA